MLYERKLKIIRDGDEAEYTYYVIKRRSKEFGCYMYNVGIKSRGAEKEIKDFSPEEREAIRLCDYLYGENVSVNNLFSAAEEFIVTL